MDKCNICENSEAEFMCEIERETFCKKCIEIEFDKMDFDSYLDFYFTEIEKTGGKNE